MEKQVRDLIDKHWEWVKDKVDINGKIYHDKYSRKDHTEFVLKCIKSWGFEHAKGHFEQYMEYGMSTEAYWRSFDAK